MNGLKIKSRNDHRSLSASDKVLRRLARAPETVNQIYELAESLYMRDPSVAGRMTFSDIEQVSEVLQQTEKDIEKIKKQFLDLAGVEGSFQTEKIPIGF